MVGVRLGYADGTPTGSAHASPPRPSGSPEPAPRRRRGARASVGAAPARASATANGRRHAGRRRDARTDPAPRDPPGVDRRVDLPVARRAHPGDRARRARAASSTGTTRRLARHASWRSSARSRRSAPALGRDPATARPRPRRPVGAARAGDGRDRDAPRAHDDAGRQRGVREGERPLRPHHAPLAARPRAPRRRAASSASSGKSGVVQRTDVDDPPAGRARDAVPRAPGRAPVPVRQR